MHISIRNTLSRVEKKQNIDRFDVELLIAFVLQKPREWVVSHPEFHISWFANFKLQRLFRLRAKGVPVAYLTGHKEFFGLDFLVNKYTLVPRPDTEIMIEAALNSPPITKSQKVPERSDRSIILIDIGTGSGCIPIAIEKTLKQKHPSLPLQTFATDISKKALKVAKKNAQTHQVDIAFLQGNLLEPILKNNSFLFLVSHSSLILTANLPYLTQNQFDIEPSIQHEPHSALVAADNGLALYKTLLNQIQSLISRFQSSITCYFEIDPSQSQLLSTHIQAIFPQANIKIIKDLCGRERIIQFVTHSPLSQL